MHFRLHGRLVETRVAGRSLAGNLLGDPAERDLLVYLPPDYDTSQRRYPVVMLLPGFAATHRSMVAWTPWKRSTIEALDDQIVRGECAPTIVAMPDSTTRFGGSQFLDSPVTGRHQSYLAEEIVAAAARSPGEAAAASARSAS
ncbi:MAG: alpha/beta hydrolase-fold protein [Myxococcota bacterium]|nr:alpha/beta hydrolase-fold protein [Myxococcota bacterium]